MQSTKLIDISTTEGKTCILERDGDITFCIVTNDGCDQNNYLLIGLKMVVSSQLPRMPKEYIIRLVFDKRHDNLIVLRGNKVIGGITYRLFTDRNFVEIVFCTVATDEQIHGFGTRLMNHLKEYLKTKVGYMLTYADENARGFFKKQGFSETVLLEKKYWKGYIKDYDSASLRCCQLFPNVNYRDVESLVTRQREFVYNTIGAQCHHNQVYYLPPEGCTDVLSIPGVREAGWDEQSIIEPSKQENGLKERLGKLLSEVWDHSDSWPFRKPVNEEEVTDYRKYIKKPMDLSLMKRKLHNNYYKDAKMFLDDLKLIVSNCKTYNQKSSSYYKCADNIEKFFMARSAEILKE